MSAETIKKAVKMKRESQFIIHKNRQDKGMYSRGMQQNYRAETLNMVEGIFADVVLDYAA